MRDLKLESIAGQIRHAIGDIDQHIKELRASPSARTASSVATLSLHEALKHLLIAQDIVQIEER